MILYRISTKKRAGDLSGTGAKLYGGRWNSPGQAVVYTSENISLATLESLAHADRSMLRQEYALCKIAIPDNSFIREVSLEALDKNWRNFPFTPTTIRLGDQWLFARDSLTLQVPSAVNPLEYNFLLNPLHKDFGQIRIQEILPVSFDLRFT